MKKLLRLIYINLLVFILLFGILELVLIILGYQPGNISKSDYFKKVEILKTWKGYITDEDGIIKISPEARKHQSEYIATGKLKSDKIDIDERIKNDFAYAPYIVAKEFIKLNSGELDSDFSRFIINLKSKKVKTDLDEDYINYTKSPINTDGFKSIEFKNHTTTKKKVLLHGDSFTWGFSASNLTNSFADLLSTKDYAVYNSGIVGVDIPQYKAIAKKYIPIIKPDFVVVNICMANDFTKYDREVSEKIPIFYPTNAGLLYSNVHGVPLETAQIAYDQIVDMASIPQTTLFNKVMSLTNVTTKLWTVLTLAGLVEQSSEKTQLYWEKAKQAEIGYSVNFKHLKEIEKVCLENNAKLLVVIIPDPSDLKAENANEFLVGFPNYKLSNLTKDDYAPEGHFNDSGHAKYAKFIDSLLLRIPKL